MRCRKMAVQLFVFMVVLLIQTYPARANPEEPLKGFDLQVKTWAEECRDEVVARFEQLMKSGKLSSGQVFDTFYVPIPNTSPQKYHTQYDQYTDQLLQKTLDGYLKRSNRILYCIITDVNGYVPTHNSKFSQPLTGNREVDAKLSRNKTIFNDRTGLVASRNTALYLIQKYDRDTGETVFDLTVPIYIRGQHWGCVRFGYL